MIINSFSFIIDSTEIYYSIPFQNVVVHSRLICARASYTITSTIHYHLSFTIVHFRGCTPTVIMPPRFPSIKPTSHRRHRHHEALSSEGVYKHTNSSIATDLSYLSLWLHTPLYHLLAALYYWRTARGSDRDQSTEATSGVIYTRPYMSLFATPFAHSSVIHTHELNILSETAEQ